jgi:glycine cleavage system H protein
LKSHEWIRPVDGAPGEFLVGISDHAQDALSDLVYVELPRVGQSLAAGATFGVVESVKAASDVYMPMDGTVVAVNSALESDQSSVNKDPYGDGWLIRIKASGKPGTGLMNADEYEAFLRETEG